MRPTSEIPLAKAGAKLYLKKEPRPLRLTETGAGAARYAPRTVAFSGFIF